jgi:RHS repeat-associated protein
MYVSNSPEKYMVMLSNGNGNGNGFADPVNWHNYVPIGSWSHFWINDFNGDGKSDIMYVSNSPEKYMVMLSNGAGFDDPVNWHNYVPIGSWLHFWINDFNGDGKSDIMYVSNSPEKYMVMLSNGAGFDDPVNWHNYVPIGSWSHFWINDFNGDGKSDIMYVSNSPEKYMVMLSRGDGFADPVNWHNYVPIGSWSHFWISDFNGDGQSDIMYLSNSPEKYMVMLSRGDGFADPVNWHDYMQIDEWSRFCISDFNGDGQSDIMYLSADSLQKYTVMKNNSSRDLLGKSSNGLGAFTTITYTPSSTYNNIVLPFVFPTLASITTNDGNGNSSIKNYTYSGGYFDYTEREFRGFQNVNSQDCLTYQDNVCTLDPYGKQTASWYHQDNIKKGLPYDQVTKDQNDYIYTRTINTYLYKQPPTNPNVNFPYLQVQDNYVFDGITLNRDALSLAWHTGISYTYDDYGNVTSKTYENMTYPDREDKKTEYTDYFHDTTNYIVSLPSTKYVKDKDNNTKAQDWFTYYTGTTNLYTKRSWLQGGTSDPVTTYEYYSNGNLWKETDPKNNPPTVITYDAATSTFPAIITNPKGQWIEKTYDPVFVGKVRIETDVNRNPTTYNYDTFGRLQTITRPLPYGITVYSFPDLNTPGNQFGIMTQHIRQEEKDLSATLIQWKETYFDGLGRTVSQKRGGPNVTDVITDTQYNSLGLVWKQSNPYFSGATIYNGVNSYDPVGRLIKTVNPDATETSTGYMQGTNTYIDANYHKKEELKDMYGRTIIINEYTGTGTTPSPYALYATTAYWYDVLNNLETVVDASDNHNQTDITYDSLSRKISMDDPDMGHWEYQYDLNGNLRYQKDEKLQQVFFQYDELNRLRQKDYGTQKTLGSGDIVYTYDQGSSLINPVGRLTTLTDNNSVTIDTYAYDPMGQVKETGKTINSQTYTTKTGYDSIGRVETITYPDNSIVKYINDALDNLIQVKDPSGAPVYVAYENYNAKGQYKNVTYANGVSATYDYYDNNNRLKSILTNNPTQGNLMNLAYDLYDDAGNIKHITDGVNTSRSRTYVYDDLDRLIEADSPAYNGKLLYQYDKIGNMTYNCKYGYYYYNDSAHVHAVTTVKKTDGTLVNTYNYDPNGNMYAGAGRALTYDYDNRPTHITANGVTVDSVYDANGQRVKKTASGSTTVYIGQTYECTSGQCTKYIISGTQIIAQISAAGTYFYHSDHLGSSSIITNASGSKAEDIFYYPYGETQTNVGSANVRYKYTGKELDSEDGLYYYGARYYDPKLARFISADTIVPNPLYPQTFNRYSYVNNNPLIYVDPTGHDEVYFDDDGTEMGRVVSNESFITYVATTNSNGGIVYTEATMPGVIAGFGSSIYQQLDYQLAALTYVINSKLESLTGLPATANHQFTENSQTPQFDVNLVKAMIMDESKMGTVQRNGTGLSDPMQSNYPGDYDNSIDIKQAVGLTKGQVMTPYTSIKAGLEILLLKGMRSDVKGNYITWKGDKVAVELYNGGGNKNYVNEVYQYYNLILPATRENYVIQ